MEEHRKRAHENKLHIQSYIKLHREQIMITPGTKYSKHIIYWSLTRLLNYNRPYIPAYRKYKTDGPLSYPVTSLVTPHPPYEQYPCKRSGTSWLHRIGRKTCNCTVLYTHGTVSGIRIPTAFPANFNC